MGKTYWEEREDWKKVTPRIQWKDIRVNEEYIIPPILGKHLRYIKVLSFFNNRLRVQVLNNKSNPYSDFLFIDDYDLEAKHIVKKHALSSPFSKI